MVISCLFGHNWNGCKCEKCGKKRDRDHDIDWRSQYSDDIRCRGICKKCLIEVSASHQWNPMPGRCMDQCTICGQKERRPCTYVRSDADCTLVCTNCGNKIENTSNHDWIYPNNNCIAVCRICGKEQEKHAPDKSCLCTRCGKVEHNWVLTTENNKLDAYKCSRCGETRIDYLEY